MSQPPPPDQTADLSAADDPLDAGLAAAFGPDSGPPLPTGGSIVRALGAVPRVHLRAPENEALTPVGRPSSDNMPVSHDPTGRLQLHGEIARGGMGAVLKGHDIDLGRDIAVKVLLETHQGKTELVQRFVEEAQIAGQLQHPGIAPVYELGQFADKRPYFTMKLVKGKTLAALLAARKEPAEERSKYVGIFAQVCQTLAYAHARSVIHRDLKPANVMVGSFGEVQVMDWGLAKVLAEGGVADEEKAQQHHTVSVIRTQRSLGSSAPEFGSHTQAGSVLGTPAYMAPEQARGEVELIDERADVFGLGAILCEVLTGQPPYTGKKAEVQRKAQTASLDDAYARLEGCGADAELIGLAKRCLAVEPWERPRDAGQVTEAVMAYQNTVAERLRQAELAQAAEAARAEEARATAAAAEAKARAERRSRRLTLALAASVLLAGVLGAAGWRWVELDRIGRAAALDARVNTALQEAVRLRGLAQGAAEGNLASWTEAVAAAKHVATLLEPGIDPALRLQAETLLAEVTAEEQQATAAVRAAERDRVLLDRLVAIRSAKHDDLDGVETDLAYAEAFREAGLDVEALPLAVVGARLKDRPAAVAVALAAALDDWATIRRNRRRDRTGAQRLTQAAQASDPDPWRRDLRTALEQVDKEARLSSLRALAKTARLDELGAVSLDLLGKALHGASDAPEAERVLRVAQQRHPGDVWVNFDLAEVLTARARRGEAIRYYLAARALRPEIARELAVALNGIGELDEAIAVLQELVRLRPKDGRNMFWLARYLQDRGRAQEARGVFAAAVAALREESRLRPHAAEVHWYIGLAMNDQKKWEDAIAAFREAIRLRPNYAYAYHDLGRSLSGQRKLDEAVAAFREAIRLQPDDHFAHHFLGEALRQQRKVDEAIAAFREAIRLRPDGAHQHLELGWALRHQGKLEEALDAFREAIKYRPNFASAHYGLGLVLRAQGKLDDAVAVFREVIRFGPEALRATNCLGVYRNLGHALRQQRKLDEALAAYREAIRLQPEDADAHYSIGNAMWNQGKPTEAMEAYREAIKHKPDFAEAYCNLGQVLRQQGQYAEAVTMLSRGHELGSKRPNWSYPSADWVRGAERQAALAEKLPAFLQGEAQPTDAAERLTLAQICYDRKWYVASARFWSDAFAVDPKLVDLPQLQHRYNAACSAALAGTGKALDDPPPDDATRAKLRQQAREWLQADLKVYTQGLADEKGVAKNLVQQRLKYWQADPDLAGLRAPDALAKLPPEEQEACRQLWAEVEAVLRKAEAKK